MMNYLKFGKWFYMDIQIYHTVIVLENIFHNVLPQVLTNQARLALEQNCVSPTYILHCAGHYLKS